MLAPVQADPAAMQAPCGAEAAAALPESITHHSRRMPQMKAIAYQHSLPAEDVLALQDIELPPPEPGPRDLLVAGAGRVGQPGRHQGPQAAPQPEAGEWKVLGWDAVGTSKPWAAA